MRTMPPVPVALVTVKLRPLVWARTIHAPARALTVASAVAVAFEEVQRGDVGADDRGDPRAAHGAAPSPH